MAMIAPGSFSLTLRIPFELDEDTWKFWTPEPPGPPVPMSLRDRVRLLFHQTRGLFGDDA